MNRCGGVFYACCPWLLRRKQAMGHGVHSPFAYEMITEVIHSPYAFYAYSDMKRRLAAKGEDSSLISSYHYLSYRLVYYLKPTNILEFGSGIGINTLFLTATSSTIVCFCVETDQEAINRAKALLAESERKCIWSSSLPSSGDDLFDAIFLNPQEGGMPQIDSLLELSHPGTFWVIHPINRGEGKLFWKEIVHDERMRKTFDLKATGIVFLGTGLQKEHFLI